MRRASDPATSRPARGRWRRLARTVALALAPAAGCGAVDGPTSVLLVTLDTTRADRLGCYGRAEAGTPHLDALAARGARFDSAHATVPLTLPTHVSLLTGTWPTRHGVRDNAGYRAAPELETLAELLAGRGLRTAAFVSAFPLYAHFGLDQGFETYDHPPSPLEENLDVRLEERGGAETVAAALAWLAALEEDEAFFAWVHLFDPHWPYAPPAPFDARHAGDPYQGEVAFADAQVGRLLAWLERAGRAGRTLVVAVSDHGEGLGERGEVTHGTLLYGSTMRVPLLVAGPGVRPGTVVAEPVSVVDVLPTVLALCGLPPAAAAQGRSLVPALSGEPLGGGERALYLESRYAREHFGWSELEGVVRGRFKLVVAPAAHDDRGELFDLAEDPGERWNLILERPEVAAELRAALDAFRAAAEDVLDARRAVDAAELAALARLGYAEGAPDPEAGSASAARAHPASMTLVADRLLRAQVAVADGDFETARVHLAEAERADPDGLAVHAVRGAYHLARAAEEPAHPADPVHPVHLGRAQAAYERVLALDPGNEDAWRKLAEVHRLRGDYRAALEHLDGALRVAPPTAKARRDRARLVEEARRHADALERRGDLEAARSLRELLGDAP